MHAFHVARNRKVWLLVILVVGTLLFGGIAVTAQGPQPQTPALALGTSFTYQGQLKSGGAPVNGSCNLAFRLYDAASSGTQVGIALTQTVPVTDGLFTTPLDFGVGAFDGNARWLDMQVRCPSGSGSFTTLMQRQALTPAPMALALPGLWTQQNPTSPNLIGGFSGNVISPAVVGATIGGGGYSFFPNRAWGNFATIGGGSGNTDGDFGTTVGGGQDNTASGILATVAGGSSNTASGLRGTVGGGNVNTASGTDATVAGGEDNTASGLRGTVGGGSVNTSPEE